MKLIFRIFGIKFLTIELKRTFTFFDFMGIDKKEFDGKYKELLDKKMQKEKEETFGKTLNPEQEKDFKDSMEKIWQK